MRLAKKFPDKHIFLVYIQPMGLPNQDQSTYIQKNFTYSFTFIL